MTHRQSAVHYWVRACILTGFSFYIVFLIQQDNLNYYIAPRMEIYVKLAALGLYAVAAFQAIRGWKEWHLSASSASCDCEHHLPKTSMGSIVTYGFFLVPLLLGFFTPDTLLGSTYAAQKGMNFSGASYYQLQNSSAANVNEQTADQGVDQAMNGMNGTPNSSPPAGNANESRITSAESGKADHPARAQDQQSHETGLAQSAAESEQDVLSRSESDGQKSVSRTTADSSLAQMFPYDMFTEVNAKHAMELYQQEVIEIPDDIFMETLTSLDLYKENFIGKTMKISGFIYRADEMNAEQFAVGRIAMACCAADSLPFGVLTEYPGAAKYEDDTWVEITGEMDVTEFNGYEIILLKAKSIQLIEQPESPYVYPNYEFGL